MILQCDQCNTRFRLDEAKLKPGGVKVRCSKCRHVFLAGAEQKLEESEFDSILSGLGAPVAERPKEEPSAPQGTSFPAEVGLPREEPGPGESQGDAFDFAPEVYAPQGAQSTTSLPGFDSSEFSFEEQPVLKEEAGSAPGETFDFGEFSFADEPAATSEEPTLAAGNGLEFGEVDFAAEPVVPSPDLAAAKDDFDFGEFSFNDEPLASEQPSAAEKESLDFSEFSFAEEPAVDRAASAPAASDAFEFGDFSFAEEPAVNSEEPVPATADAIDSGEFSFAEEPALKGEYAAEVADDAHDFELSFAEEPAPKAGESAAASKEPFGFGDFSFDEEPAPLQEDEAAEKESFDFEEFSFAAQPPPVKEEAAVAASEDFYYEELKRDEEALPALSPAVAAKRGAAQEATLDFSFGSRSKAASVSEDNEEELPPLAISSRRKGRSLLTVSIVAFCVLVIVALTGAGLYLLQSGPAALQKFDQLGLGFVGKWFGMESPEEGRITIRNPLAAFDQNKEAGEIFVVTGEVVNSYRKARASIHVKVSLFDKNGAVLLQKTAYCGNKLSKEQLATLPVAKIESIMNNQFGDSLANLGVQPGHAIGFVVAIPHVPKEAADFGVEVVGSTVAGQ